MLQIKDSMDQGFDLGREGTAVSSPWCLRAPPGRLKGWSKNHLEASSLDCPAVAVGPSLGLLSRTSTCGLSTWAAPLSFLIAWQLNPRAAFQESRAEYVAFYRVAPKVTLHRSVYSVGWWKGDAIVPSLENTTCHSTLICLLPAFTISHWQSLKVSKDVIFQFFSFLYNDKITLNSKSNISIGTKLGKHKNLFTIPPLQPIMVIIFRLFIP